MGYLSILLIAIALASDAFAASLTFGMTKKIVVRYAFKIALYFGFFQWLMAFSGWFFCLFFRSVIEPVDHWISFGLLVAIGINTMLHSREEAQKVNSTSIGPMVFISLATSVDALATGVSFSVLNIDIIIPSLIIGSITFLLSFIGVYLGKKLKKIIKNQSIIYCLSGLILIIIGFSILLEHFLT
ncbi:putative Mn2+ efflux pump MntP [Natranaerovirga pectinivora]|uniref:Putative manganese efflux pump MntP n=1 Tax=Natranaerovirga pectinivora TaxID=682400 RepID=A0A4R3MJB7_9FIRM|nr:manganese efflux pump [Natranaerovirga pectinivora]TCT14364.1 putative Mn2+ efflux pump MntP [Natranaerovirga pectinivora]